MKQHSLLFLDHKIGIQKNKAESFGQHDADRTLSCARHTDQHNIILILHVLLIIRGKQ